MDSITQQQRANKIFLTIKQFQIMFPEEFEKCNINACGHCNNSGFSNIHNMTLCNHCGGIGWVGFEKLMGEYVCRSCNGYGCRACKQSGTVDWVRHATGNDIIKGKYI